MERHVTEHPPRHRDPPPWPPPPASSPPGRGRLFWNWFQKRTSPPVDPAADRKRLAHNASNSAYKRRKRLDLVQINIEVPAFATPDWLRDERFLDDWNAEQRPLNKGDKAKVRDALEKYVRLRSRYGFYSQWTTRWNAGQLNGCFKRRQERRTPR
jgi:hypothetical protein